MEIETSDPEIQYDQNLQTLQQNSLKASFFIQENSQNQIPMQSNFTNNFPINFSSLPFSEAWQNNSSLSTTCIPQSQFMFGNPFQVIPKIHEVQKDRLTKKLSGEYEAEDDEYVPEDDGYEDDSSDEEDSLEGCVSEDEETEANFDLDDYLAHRHLF